MTIANGARARVPTLSVVVVTGLLLSACSDDSSLTEPGDPEDEVIISDEALVVDSTEASLVRFEGDTLAFELAAEAPDFSPGNVVVGEEGGGFLRRVTAVEREGSQAMLETEQAALADVIERGFLEITESIGTDEVGGDVGGETIIEPAEGVRADAVEGRVPLSNVELYSGESLDVFITDGSFEYDVDVELAVDFGGGPPVEEFTFIGAGSAALEADLEVTASSAIEHSAEKQLFSVTRRNVRLIGKIPVAYSITVAVVAEYEGGLEAAGGATAGFETTTSFALGGDYTRSHGWESVEQGDGTSLGHRDVSWGVAGLAGDGKVGVRLDISAAFYEVAGPFVRGTPYLDKELQFGSESWSWALGAGLDGAFGGNLGILDWELTPFSWERSLWTTELASNSGETGGAVDIPDANLEAAIREELGKSEGDLTPADMRQLEEFQAEEREIADLTGLGHAEELRALELAENQISDLSPLEGLTALEWLVLNGNAIEDLSPLEDLVALEVLAIHRNDIDDLSPLKDLTNLREVHGSGSRPGGQIDDLSPLAGLTRLERVWLESHEIRDLSPLEDLTHLTHLSVAFNEVEDISALAGRTDFVRLRLADNEVRDISPLEGFTRMRWLDLSRNNIEDISPLEDMTELEVSVRLDSNDIADLQALVNNEGLGAGTNVNVRRNPLSEEACDEQIPALEARGVEVIEDSC